MYQRGRLTHGLRRWFISACRNASARREVIELMTHNAKGEVIDAYTSWEWSTLFQSMFLPAISRNGLDAETPLNPSESELADQLGTRVPNFDSIDDLSERVRRAWGVLRVV